MFVSLEVSFGQADMSYCHHTLVMSRLTAGLVGTGRQHRSRKGCFLQVLMCGGVVCGVDLLPQIYMQTGQGALSSHGCWPRLC